MAHKDTHKAKPVKTYTERLKEHTDAQLAANLAAHDRRVDSAHWAKLPGHLQDTLNDMAQDIRDELASRSLVVN